MLGVIACMLERACQNRTPAWKVVNEVRALQSKISVSCARCSALQRVDLLTDRIVRELYRGAGREYGKLLDAVLDRFHAYEVTCPCCGAVGHLPHEL